MKVKLESESRITKIIHDINQPLELCEPHFGDRTFVNGVYHSMADIQKRLNAAVIPSGDLINASDLMARGLLSKETVLYQMDDFEKYFLPFPIPGIMQNNHGTRIYGKSLPRQFGESLVSRWEKILGRFKEKNPRIKILGPDEVCFELHLYDNGKCSQKGIVWHPSGLSSAEAFVRRVAQNVQDFDFSIVFHFHRNMQVEITKMCPDGYFDVSKVKFVPPMIENPRYGIGRYAPINAGFLLIRKVKDDITGKTGIIFKEYTKADL